MTLPHTAGEDMDIACNNPWILCCAHSAAVLVSRATKLSFQQKGRYMSSSACTQGLLAVNVATGWIHTNQQRVTQPWGLGRGGLPKSWQRKSFSPHTCTSSTWLNCAFMQQNQMPFSSLILSLLTFHPFYRDKALQLRASMVSWCSNIRKGHDVGQGGTSGTGRVNPSVSATVVFKQEGGQKGISGFRRSLHSQFTAIKVAGLQRRPRCCKVPCPLETWASYGRLW